MKKNTKNTKNIKSVIESLLDKLTSDFDNKIDNKKIINDIKSIIINLTVQKQLLESINDYVNGARLDNNNNIKFDYYFRLDFGLDFLSDSINYLTDFVEKNQNK